VKDFESNALSHPRWNNTLNISPRAPIIISARLPNAAKRKNAAHGSASAPIFSSQVPYQDNGQNNHDPDEQVRDKEMMAYLAAVARARH